MLDGTSETLAKLEQTRLEVDRVKPKIWLSLMVKSYGWGGGGGGLCDFSVSLSPHWTLDFLLL